MLIRVIEIFGAAILLAILSSCASFENSDQTVALSRYEQWEEFQASYEKQDDSGQKETLSNNPTLRECQLYAAMHNPDLQAAFHGWQAAIAKIPQAQSLPNPKVSYTYFFQRVETRTGSQRQSLALQQTFPAWGKIAARTDAAAAKAKAEYQHYQAVKYDIYSRVQKAWAELYYAQMAVKLTRDKFILLQQVEKVLHQRYKTSDAGKAELLRVQVDLEKIRDRNESLQKRLSPLQAALNKELGRDVKLPVKIKDFPQMEMINVDSAKAIRVLRLQNPELLAFRDEIDAANENVKLAKAYQLPDVTMGVGWVDTAKRSANVSDNGKDPIMGTISVDMPIWFEANKARIRQARHLKNMTEIRFTSELLNSQSNLEDALFQHEDTQRRIKLYRSVLVPKSAESWKVTQNRYINQLASYNDMIDTLQTLLEFELGLERVRANCLIARGILEKLTTKTVAELAKNDISKKVDSPSPEMRASNENNK